MGLFDSADSLVGYADIAFPTQAATKGSSVFSYRTSEFGANVKLTKAPWSRSLSIRRSRLVSDPPKG